MSSSDLASGLLSGRGSRLNKRSVSAKALVKDISNGLSNAQLMSRHEIDYAQLQKFFGQLIQAGHLAPEALVGRSHDETGATFAESSGNAAQAERPEPSSSKPPHPVEPGPHAEAPAAHPGAQPRKHQDDALSLPMSREQASRFRRNGLILILVSYGLLTMQLVLYKIVRDVGPGASPKEYLGAVLFLVIVAYIVSAVLGCLWRERGLGQNAVWAIVAPFPGINVLVMEALPNRYEPDEDRRVLRLAFAVGGLAAWTLVLSQVVNLL